MSELTFEEQKELVKVPLETFVELCAVCARDIGETKDFNEMASTAREVYEHITAGRQSICKLLLFVSDDQPAAELKSSIEVQEPQFITYDVHPSDDPAIIGADIVSTIDLLLKDMASNPRAVTLTINVQPVRRVAHFGLT